MQVKLKGNKTTYYAGYKSNILGDNKGVGLWTNNYTVGDITDIAYLWPDDNGSSDNLIINLAEATRQGINVLVKTDHGLIALTEKGVI